MAASSSQPETMKAECSLENPKVQSYILFQLHLIQCATEENFMIFC